MWVYLPLNYVVCKLKTVPTVPLLTCLVVCGELVKSPWSFCMSSPRWPSLVASVKNEERCLQLALAFSQELLHRRGCHDPWPLVVTLVIPENQEAHGKPAASLSSFQIRLLTCRSEEVLEVARWQLGEERGLNNQSFWLGHINRIGTAWKVKGNAKREWWRDTVTFCTRQAV